ELTLSILHARSRCGTWNRSTMGGHFFACYDSDDSRHTLRLGRIDALDPRVCITAARDGHVQHAWQHDIVDVCRGAGDQPRILFSLHSLTDKTLRHANLLFMSGPPASPFRYTA